MDEKNKQLLDQILKYAAERKIQIPADIVLKLSTIYAEDLYSELKQGQAPSETEGKILMGTLRKLVEQIVLEEIPEFGLMNPGLVPAPGRSGLMLMSTGWKPYLMPSAPGGGGGGGTGISDAPGDSQSYVRYNRTWIVMPPGVTQHSLLTGLDYASAGHTGFQPTLTFPLSPTLGGTGIANLAASTLTLGAATSITGGGTLGLGGFTGSVPATGTFAMGAGTLTSTTSNNAAIAAHTHAITGSPLLVGNGTGVGQVIISDEFGLGPPFFPAWSTFYLGGTTGGKTIFGVSNTKTLTLTATDDRNITFPITGTAAIGAGTLTAATTNDVTVNAHTHAITASTALVAAGTAQYQVLTTGANPYPAGWSGFYLDGTTGGKTILAVTNTKTLTLTAADSYNLTIPATGTAALGTGAATRIGYWSDANTLTGDTNFIWDAGNIRMNIGGVTTAPDTLMVRPGAGTGKNGITIQCTTAAGGVESALSIMHNNPAGYGGRFRVDGGSGDFVFDLVSGGTWYLNDIDFDGNTGSIKFHRPVNVITENAAINGLGIYENVNSINSARITYFRSRGTYAGPTTVVDGDYLGMFDYRARVTSGYIVTAYIGTYINGTVDATTAPTDFYIATSATNDIDPFGNNTVRLLISSTGLVTVGRKTTGTGLFNVIGNADIQQLIVTGHTTQATATPMAQITRNDAAAGISAILGLTALGSGANGDGGSILYNGKTSTTVAQPMGKDEFLFVNATHATYTTRRIWYAYDVAGAREGLRIEASGTAPMIGFLGAAAVVRPSAYTQTYSTASKTVPNATATNPPAGGTGATEGAYDTAAHRDEMITALTNNIADVDALKQVVTALIDDLQSLGLVA